MEQLISITHPQWIHRNAIVHFKRSDGHTIAQHQDIIDHIKQLLWDYPDHLLHKDKHLLNEDSNVLCYSGANYQDYWIASMESALTAAAHT